MHALFSPKMLLAGALAFLAPFGAPAGFAAQNEEFHITTLRAQMRYDVTEINTTPGSHVKVVFENADDMPHNMIFCQPGTDVVALSNRQMEHPEEALKRNWLPEDPSVWLHSKLLNPHEKEELTFVAPEKPGEYPFFCSFPGHVLTMKGRLHVFPNGEGLKDLHFKLYLGDWKTLPDFSTLTPHREGSVPDNLVQLKFDDYKNQYGVVFTGKINAPKQAEYFFLLSSDDGGRILIDGKKVVEYDGIHPAGDIKEGKVKLNAGEHDFTLEYFQAAGQAEIFAAWRSADFAVTPLSKWLHPNWKAGAVAKKKKADFNGMPIEVGAEPVLYRNFITGAGNRGIAVGYPGQASIAWSAESMNLAEFWRGAFMDAARHWRDRGGGFQPPLGFDVVRTAASLALPLATAESAKDGWPKVEPGGFAEGCQWKGYRLDEKQYPTFLYRWDKIDVSDRFEVEGNALSGGKLSRVVKLMGEIPAGTLFFLAEGKNIESVDGGFRVDGGVFEQDGRGFENKTLIQTDGAKLFGNYLVVPARPEIRVTYAWPETHMHAGH